jgi:hypothetical protein
VAISPSARVNLRVLTKICILMVFVGELICRSVNLGDVCDRKGSLDDKKCLSVCG